MPYPYAPEAARRHLVAAGITRCWSLPYAHRAGVAGPLNRWMAETWGADSRVLPGATVHPDDDVAAIVGEAIDELGLTVFKLHCSVGAFSPEDSRLDPLWERVAAQTNPAAVRSCPSAPSSDAAS